MSKRSRRNNSQEDNFKNKVLISSGVVLAILAAIVISFVMYGNQLNGNVKESKLSSEQIASLMSNEVENTIVAESASSTIGKSIEEAEKQENSTKNESNNTNSTVKKEGKEQSTNDKEKKQNSTKNNIENKTAETSVKQNVSDKDNKKQESKEEKKEEKKELNFQMPVDGEIVREFAKENLIYSNTLKEWITHNGVDIKADKTTVVKAAEDGTVKTIKNDPRYGLTVVIEHSDNMKTVYSNLLTAEFVVEGENVTKGQTIGTVGNTAVFEISDEPHLHFEMWKEQSAVDPTVYLK